MTTDHDHRKLAKPLAWLLMLSTLTLFANALRLQHRPDNTTVAHQFTEPNPLFAHAYQAALSSAE